MLLHAINNYLGFEFSAPGRNSEITTQPHYFKDAAQSAPDASGGGENEARYSLRQLLRSRPLQKRKP
jgi:hypothetical protein